MTVTLVQQVAGSRPTSANMFTSGVAATTVGNVAFIIVGPGASTASGAVISVTDDAAAPNTWSRGAVGFISGRPNSRVELWWCNITSSFTTVAVFTGVSQAQGYNFTEWSGLGAVTLDAASPDNSAQTVASNTVTTPTITPTAPLIVFAAQHESGSLFVDDFDPTTATPTTGWVAMADHDSSFTALGRAAYNVPASNGSFAGSWTLSSPKPAGTLTVAFRSAGTLSVIAETFTLTSDATTAANGAATQSTTTFTLASAVTRTATPDATVSTTFTVGATAGSAKAVGSGRASTFTVSTDAIVTHPAATLVGTSFGLTASTVVDRANNNSLTFTAGVSSTAQVNASGAATRPVTWSLTAAAGRTATSPAAIPSSFALNASVALAHQFTLGGGGAAAFTGAKTAKAAIRLTGGGGATMGASAPPVLTNPGLRLVIAETGIRLASSEARIGIVTGESAVLLPS